MTSEEYGQLIDDFELGADVMPDESLTEYIERRRREFESKADGGSIGIEVFFGPKRGEYQTGGQAYDPRASAVDYATALEKVGGGTTAQKRQDLSNYLGNLIATQGQKLGTAAVIPLQAAKGVLGIQGTPITDSMQASLQKIIQDKVSKTGKLKGGIDYRDYGVKTTTGKEFEGFGKRSITDPEAALATTLGQADYVVDPKTGKVTFTGGTAYDFRDDQFGGLGKFISKGGVFSDQATQYNPDITLGSDFMKQTRKPLSEEKFYEQFYGVPYDPYKGKYFIPTDKSDPNYYKITQADTYSKFKNLVDSGIIDFYTGPTDYKTYLKNFADGGRVPMVSGGALKSIGSGIMKLFGKGDDTVDLAKQEEIFREGPITKEFLETVDSKVINPFVRTRDAKGVGSYGLYDNFDDMPAGLKAAEIIKRFVNRKTGEIDYEAAEFFIGRKLKGDETINELIDIAISKPIGSGKSANLEELMADGGRVGLFMGGPALEGQALQIYNSMSAYGFSDQEIADALKARGLFNVASTTTTPVTNTTPNIINQGDRGQDTTPPPKDPYAGLGFSSANFGLGKDLVNKDAVMDYEADAYSIGRTPLGQLSKFGLGIFSALKNLPTPFNLVRKGIEFAKQKELEKKAKEEAIARDAFREAMRQGPSFYDSLNEGRGASVSRASREQAGPGFGDVSESGSFAKGGLTTMFTRRR